MPLLYLPLIMGNVMLAAMAASLPKPSPKKAAAGIPQKRPAEPSEAGYLEEIGEI